ncbi:selenoprotein S-like [Sycon ciliatum]|uniref:selenoprotein S-like n=1 Tax=Sycon ciliatum TaxID=27933 RepID=UPI0020AC9FA3|eukprot:scpid77702/ scgid20519/ Selenoprotein S; VCP-interacting membrane protein
MSSGGAVGGDSRPGGFAGMPSPNGGHAPDLEGADSTMASIYSVISSPFVFLQAYGWVVVGIILVCYLIWTRVRERFYELYDRTMEKREAANMDPSVAAARQEAQAAARDRMQRDLDEKAQLYAEKQKADEERKRQEKIEDWDRHQRGEGYRNRVKKPDEAGAQPPKGAKKRTLRDSDYNPLTGDSSGGGGGGFRRASGRHTFRSGGG